MPKSQTTPLTIIQALDRAHWMIDSGRKLRQIAQSLSEARGETARRAADELKEIQLLSYRVSTVPDSLVPVLEALIDASSGARRLITTPHELETLNTPGTAIVWKGSVYGAERAANNSQLHWIGPGLATATTIRPSADQPATVIFEPAS